MLTSDYLDTVSDPILSLYRDFEDDVIRDIARRLGNMSFSSAAWQVQRLSESALLYEDILKRLSKLTGQSENVLRDIFRRAGVKSLKFDDSIYKAAGLNPLPLHLSPAMVAVLQAGLIKTNGLMQNLTRTTAISAQQSFIHAVDVAYQKIVTGTFSYDQAIRQAVKNVAADGLHVIQFTGHKDHLDVAARRAILTGVSQTTGILQMTRADQMGVDLVQTSAHIGARPEHQTWQGKIFSRSGTDKKYPDFKTSTGYGTGAGLNGWNCRHSWFPFFKGISENAYSREDLRSFKRETVPYNGENLDVYQATQIQRGMERKVRQWKREAAAMNAAKQDNSFELSKVKQWQARLRDLISQTGLQRQYVREQVL